MRQTDYMGRENGARAVELRRGSTHHVDIGSVERHSAEQRALGASILRFKRAATISGLPAKTLAARLHEITMAYHRGQISAEQRMTAIDTALSEKVTQ
jgi:hypothetical protein